MPNSSDPSDRALAALEAAHAFDSSLKFVPGRLPALRRSLVTPLPYTRENLFQRMQAGEPALITGFRDPVRGSIQGLPPQDTATAIVNWMATCGMPERHRIFTGAKGVRRQVTLAQLAQMWRTSRARFGVTDLHIRQTRMEEIIDPDILSAFNILCNSTPDARAQEMFSFVISSRGYVTDSHSDAPDSSNFCFTGEKLWLCWDTYEGARAGLQDVERMRVSGKAKFDIESWLSLPSARWLLVTPFNTLFLPARFSHKVITMEKYIGVGGFFIALPNCLRLLAHWIVHGPLWSKGDYTGRTDKLIGDIALSARDLILKLRGGSREARLKWGHDYLESSALAFIKSCSPSQFKIAMSDSRLQSVAGTIDVPWPLTILRQKS